MTNMTKLVFILGKANIRLPWKKCQWLANFSPCKWQRKYGLITALRILKKLSWPSWVKMFLYRARQISGYHKKVPWTLANFSLFKQKRNYGLITTLRFLRKLSWLSWVKMFLYWVRQISGYHKKVPWTLANFSLFKQKRNYGLITAHRILKKLSWLSWVKIFLYRVRQISGYHKKSAMDTGWF